MDVFSLAGTCFWQKTPLWRTPLLQQTVQFGASLTTHLEPQTSPNILLTEKPFPGSCPVVPLQVMQQGSFCQVGLSVWHPCRNPLKAAKDFCQNRDRSLKEHPLFSLKSMSHQPSCYLSTVNSTALMVNFTSRKRLHFVKRKF